jgi:hypothetical protein
VAENFTSENNAHCVMKSSDWRWMRREVIFHKVGHDYGAKESVRKYLNKTKKIISV